MRRLFLIDFKSQDLNPLVIFTRISKITFWGNQAYQWIHNHSRITENFGLLFYELYLIYGEINSVDDAVFSVFILVIQGLNEKCSFLDMWQG